MNEEQRARAEELFLDALSQPAAERAAWVRQACGGEAEVLAEVLSLLMSAQDSDSYLASLAAGSGAPFAAERQAQEPGREGERVGRYELIREIGRGGMGAVYLAERVDGEFEQRVAIKLLRRGVDTDDILARFRIERQILASLSHPHIARLLDGGATDDGRPFLVMELVEGVPITEHCDAQRLTVRERLHLFLQVARAVQHAHGKLIAHRDIKPSNILVTTDGTPKLLDFGIARLLDDDSPLASESPRTRTELRLMTPEYASPEQLRGEPVTAASDAYQLGVLLYQLLAGRRPYRLDGRTAGEVERIVAEEDRPSPSAMLTAPPEPTQVAAGGAAPADPEPEQVAHLRGTDVRGLRALLRGDLDTILMKAVQPEPERRYASAGELADDVQRHLDGLPILARTPSLGYRAGKFARRHRTATAVGALTLVAVTTGATWESWRSAQVMAERERSRYEAERDRAKFAAEQAAAMPVADLGSTAVAINDHGVIVGTIPTTFGVLRTARWDARADGTVTGPHKLEIPSLPQALADLMPSRPSGINNRGTIVGSDDMGESKRALIYHEGEARPLSRPPRAISVRAEGINDAGWVIGAADFPGTDGLYTRGLLWLDPLSPDVPPVQLPAQPGVRYNSGNWITAGGWAGGYVTGGRGVSWRLGPEGAVLSGPDPLGARPNELNGDGAIVGAVAERPFFLPVGGAGVTLETLEGHERGRAVWLNSPAEGEPTLIVGASYTLPDPGHILPKNSRAVLWRVQADGTVYGPVELRPAPGFNVSTAASANANGWVVGSSGPMPTLWQPLPDGTGYRAIPLGLPGVGPEASLVHICDGATCSFADTSRQGSGSIVLWSWDSGAGGTADAREVLFTYPAPGRYTITLQVADVSGRRDEAAVEVVCRRRPPGRVRCR
jgi:serine/threonine protein kinase/uncharacterized membrane protein